MVKYSRAVVLFFLLFGVAVGIANADSVFDFENTTAFGTPFMETSNGVTASFTATPGPSFSGPPDVSFEILPLAGEFSSLTGNALTNPNSGPWILTVDFSRDATSISCCCDSQQSGRHPPQCGCFYVLRFGKRHACRLCFSIRDGSTRFQTPRRISYLYWRCLQRSRHVVRHADFRYRRY